MTGLTQRFRRRRAARPVTQDTQPTIPAGIDPQEAAAPAAPSFRDRGRLRRRLRYLRRVRELGFRDLGGLVFDLHRFGRQGDQLVGGKLAALAAVDSELRALETVLNDRRPITELREPGIASCPRCGALHGSDARFCPACGVPFSGPRPLGEVGEGGVRSVGEIGAVTPAPAPGTPAPAAPAAQDAQSPALPGEEPSGAPQADPGDQPTVAMTAVDEQDAAAAAGAGEPVAQRADVREP
jgi:hypothetical protein